MIKITIVFIAVLSIAIAAPPPVPFLSQTEVRDDFNQFALSYSTGNGIAVAQQGALKQIVDEEGQVNNVLVQNGSYAYYGPDGRLYRLNYIADENGFQPQADFLPTPPPVVA